MSHPVFEALRADMLALCDDVGRAQLPATYGRQLDVAGAELAAPFYVVVCGEFSRGKSSLLNALVERPGLFPVDTAVTTAVVTELHWGEQETATVLGGDNVATEERVPLDRIADFLTEQRNPGNQKRVRLVRITAPIERLRHGLALVDTPGIGSLNVEHAMATYAFLAKADAVLFVGAADERMSTVELSYLKDAIDRCRTVVTVLTKTDKLVDPGPAGEVAVTRERIAQVSGLAPDQVMVVGVSARRKQMALTRDDPDRLRRSGFPELEELLWRRLAVTLGADRLRGTLDLVREVLAALAAPVANELAALADERALVDMRVRLEELQAHALATRTADWRQDLVAAFQAAAIPVQERLAADCERLVADLHAQVQADRVEDDPHVLMRKAVTALVDAMQRADEGLRAAATETAAEISKQTRLPLTVDVRPTGLDQDLSLELPRVADPRPGSDARFLTVFNTTGVVGGVGASLGAIGALVFPGVGAVVGLASTLAGNLIGLFIGLREQAERAREQREERARVLHDDVLPAIRERADSARTILTESVAVTREELLAEFDARMEATQESLARSIAVLEELRTATVLERSRRHAELITRQEDVRTFQNRLAVLRQRIGTLG